MLTLQSLYMLLHWNYCYYQLQWYFNKKCKLLCSDRHEWWLELVENKQFDNVNTIEFNTIDKQMYRE